MRYLTFTELRAKLGGRSRSTIYRDVASGRLPRPIRLGHRLYWVEIEVDEAMARLANVS
ncbi:MAG: AlpA family phage regulatory protein [Pseudomonadota bacterium]